MINQELWQLILFVSLSIALDWLLVQRGSRWLETQFHLKTGFNTIKRSLGFVLFRLTLRCFIWLSLGVFILREVEVATTTDTRKVNLGQFLIKRLETIFTTPFATLGQAKISLLFIFTILIFSLVVYLCARWLSEWIRSQVLVYLGIDRGSQEAISRVISYLLTLIGFIIVLQTAGIDLSSLTVLAGILGIGFGFGLQTLASNFLSGLAILLEHPIKVGDFVEVDGLAGTVEKISIRATVLRTNDNQYVIVPNNRFIENNVFNWSYGSPHSRIHIPISVARGSDTVLVTEILLSCARQEPRVLAGPPPTVWLQKFGENGYQFTLLVWIDCPQDASPIQSSLNFLIEQEFLTCGIEIPYHQVDLHVRDQYLAAAMTNVGTGTKEQPVRQIAATTTTRPGANQPLPRRLQPLKDLLRNISYFAACSESELRTVIELGYRQFFPYNHVIFREQDTGDTFYIILSGSVEVYSEKLEKSLAVLKRGDFFGEMSILTGMPRTATVRCLEDSTLFVINRQVLESLLQAYPNLSTEIAQELSQRQQVLEALGLVNARGQVDSSMPPFVWLQERLKTLFNLEP